MFGLPLAYALLSALSKWWLATAKFLLGTGRTLAHSTITALALSSAVLQTFNPNPKVAAAAGAPCTHTPPKRYHIADSLAVAMAVAAAAGLATLAALAVSDSAASFSCERQPDSCAL